MISLILFAMLTSTVAQLKPNTYDNGIVTFNIEFYENNDYENFGIGFTNDTCLANGTKYTYNYTCPCILNEKCENEFFESKYFKLIEYNGIKLIDTCKINFADTNNTHKCFACGEYSIRFNYKQTGKCNLAYIIVMAVLVGVVMLFLIFVSTQARWCPCYKPNNYIFNKSYNPI